MSSQFNIDNSGIGGTPFLTFSVDTSATKDFTQTDIDNNLTACVISANNEVGMGIDGGKLFGKVVWVSQELVSGTTVPALCAVQARGVARFKYVATTPVINQMVECDGAGKVKQAIADADIAAGGHLMRGQVIAVDVTNSTCDVWLG
ncbi:MAG: hypothetical protein HN356_01710 [Calditrichaeota bacterium]|nr:hypothetical protein [Calditrichota bacterium]MBT7618400.1 hypothetical protein [Calditrichota bacterium]MBT7788095.1 hypothetical protein [Calditrichota bacterium]